MPSADVRLVAALREQLCHRDAALRRGAQRVGWKLGMGLREKIGDHIAVGYLTTETVVGDARCYRVSAGGDRDVHVDAELCVELGSDVDRHADADAVRAAIACCWPALEVVDLARRPGEPDSIVAENVFHLAVAIGHVPIPVRSEQRVSVDLNGQPYEKATWPVDVPDRIASAASIVGALDERLCAGDRIITGSVIQVPTAAGDVVRAHFGDHASIAIALSAQTDM